MLVKNADYHQDCIRICGRALDHNDSLNDRTPGGKLDQSFQQTDKLWSEQFGEPFTVPGGMYRGEPPDWWRQVYVRLNEPGAFIKANSENQRNINLLKPGYMFGDGAVGLGYYSLRSKEALHIFLDRLTAQRSELESKTQSCGSLLSNLYDYLNRRGCRQRIAENETATAFIKARIQFSDGPFDPVTEKQIVQLGGDVTVYRRQQEIIQSKLEEQYEIRRRLSSTDSSGHIDCDARISLLQVFQGRYSTRDKQQRNLAECGGVAGCGLPPGIVESNTAPIDDDLPVSQKFTSGDYRVDEDMAEITWTDPSEASTISEIEAAYNDFFDTSVLSDKIQWYGQDGGGDVDAGDSGGYVFLRLCIISPGYISIFLTIIIDE